MGVSGWGGAIFSSNFEEKISDFDEKKQFLLIGTPLAKYGHFTVFLPFGFSVYLSNALTPYIAILAEAISRSSRHQIMHLIMHFC